jgi:hypothetical protein
MPYNPKAPTQDDRTFAYNALWLGLPLSIILLASMQFEALSIFTTLAGGFVCGTLIGQVFSGWQDEVYRAEVGFAANFALAFAGVVLFAQIVPWARDHELDQGTMLAIMALIFHAAIVYRRNRDR